ncbi:MAG: UDP-glucose 4-epimerase GalE, partial [Planctomycetota bacterium]
MNVLVTGGAGYIGSHAALRLLEAGHEVTVVDDLSRGRRGAVEALAAAGELCVVEADFGDRARLEPVLRRRDIELVMHFAALAYVGESVEQPLRYYRNNLANAVALLEAMEACGVERLVFSSTCATYGEPGPEHIPITESCPQDPVTPYGRTKLAVEQLLFDHLRARGRSFAFASLRYFNVAGCEAAGRLGEDHDPETHLIPICLEAALGRRGGVTIFGTDYGTPDGTCIRDYVHVDDLVEAHLVAMTALQPGEALAYNVGIGRGASVREVIEAARRVTGV